MASIRKRAARWQARVIRKGYPDRVKTFAARQDAERWARATEAAMDRGAFLDRTLAEQTTFGEVLRRYASEVTPTKRGAETELRRLTAMQRHRMARLSMAALRPQDIADYRDLRLGAIQGSTVNREMQLLGAVVNHAMREWRIPVPFNPVEQVRKPHPGRGRSRVFEGDEESRLFAALDGEGYKRVPRIHHNPWVRPIVELALETACRRGEILSMRWEQVDLGRRIIRLPITKNGEERLVPLSVRATALLQSLPRSLDGRLFPIQWTALHQAFKKACRRASIEDFHFHDLRHVAVTRLASKLPNVIELAAVTGHKTLTMLRRYYHVRAEDLAKKLG